MDQVQHWLALLPPILIYLLVGGVIGAESLGIPVPGEITLVSASLLAANHNVDIWWVAIAATTGAIVGDSIGYAIGRRGGRRMLERMGRRFPRHLGPPKLAKAERAFDRWGVWAVFFGRFVALLRILAGPLAGALKVPYPRFLLANAAGGILWGCGTAFLIWGLGRAAERWLSGFSWVALLVAIACGAVTMFVFRHRAGRVLSRDTGAAAPEDRTPASDHDRVRG
jgi:membrane protein DedA with SNARE-associated domain